MTVTDMDDHVIMVLVWFMVSVIKEFFKVCMLFVGFLSSAGEGAGGPDRVPVRVAPRRALS